MQATVLDGGKTGIMAALFGFRDHSNDINVVRDIVGSPFDSVKDSLNLSLQQLNNAYMGSETINMGRMIAMRHDSIYDPMGMNIVTKNNIQNSNNRMKEIILSHPEVARLSNSGFIDGYAGITPDLELSSWVNDGVVDLDNGLMSYTTYNGIYDDVFDEIDKHIITETWRNVQDMLAEGIDPTSKELSYF